MRIWNDDVNEQVLWSIIEKTCRRQKAQYPLSFNPVQKLKDLGGPECSKSHRLKVMKVTDSLSLSWTHIVRFRNSWWFIMFFFMSYSTICLPVWALFLKMAEKPNQNKISQSNYTHNFGGYLTLKTQDQVSQAFCCS